MGEQAGNRCFVRWDAVSPISGASGWGATFQWALIGVGAALRYWAFLEVAPPSSVLFSDMRYYADVGVKIFLAQPLTAYERFFVPLGLPKIHAVFLLGGLDPAILLPMLNILLDMLSCILIARLGGLLVSGRTALWALTAGCLFPASILQCGFPLGEPVFTFLGVTAYYWYVKACLCHSSGLVYGFLSGLSLFAALQFKTNLILLPVLAVLASVFFPWFRCGGRYLMGFTVALLISAGVSGFYGNDRGEATGAQIVANPAVNFYQGRTNTPRLVALDPGTSRWVYNAPPALSYLSQDRKGTVVVSRSILDGWYFLGKTADYIADHPLTLLTYSMEHVLALFGLAPYWPLVQSDYAWLDPLLRGVVLALVVIPAIIGIFAPIGLPAKTFLLLPIVSIVIVAMAFFGSPRYRLPFDGYLIVMAAVGVQWMIRSLHRVGSGGGASAGRDGPSGGV